MVEIAVKYLQSTTGARFVAGDPDRVCRGVEIDSRAVAPDAVFVAFPGERVDGNAFAPAAIEAGAGAVVMTCEPTRELVDLALEHGSSILVADDPTEFLLRLAQGYRARLRCTVIGITGSIGKTTTKDVLAACLAKRYRVHATAGNFNSLIGLPLTILSAPADTQMLVLEMGMSDFGEIERLSRFAQPTFGIITKVGTSLLGEMGELGDDAERLHALVGAYAAAKRPSMLICVGGENARVMADAARLMGLDEGDVQVVPSCDALIRRYAGVMGERDLVLVKGSRFVGLDRFVEEVCADAR